MHFWEAPRAKSTCHSSVNKGSPTIEATLSTTVIILYLFSKGHIWSIGFNTPEGVSQCTIVAYLKSWSFSKNSFNSFISIPFVRSPLNITGFPPYILTKSANPSPKIPLSITKTRSFISVKEAHAASKPRIPSPDKIKTSSLVLSKSAIFKQVSL